MKYLFSVALAALFYVHPSYGEEKYIDSTSVDHVAVNGGVDTNNPGTSCIKVLSGASSQCPQGFIGIPNNNEKLLSAALTANAAGKVVWLYYEDSSTNLHCPGLVFTPCSLISIMIK